jgi:hypothetical protein
MSLTEDLSLFLADFGVTVTSGAVTGLGILDMPGQVVAGEMIITTDYRLTAKTSEFGGLIYGAAVTVNGINYQVRDAMKIDDGEFTELRRKARQPARIHDSSGLATLPMLTWLAHRLAMCW